MYVPVCYTIIVTRLRKQNDNLGEDMKESTLTILNSDVDGAQKAVLVYDLIKIARKLNSIECVKDIIGVALSSNEITEENKDLLFAYGYECFKEIKEV